MPILPYTTCIFIYHNIFRLIFGINLPHSTTSDYWCSVCTHRFVAAAIHTKPFVSIRYNIDCVCECAAGFFRAIIRHNHISDQRADDSVKHILFDVSIVNK